MRIKFLILAFLIIALHAFAEIYTWNVSSGDWTLSTNWLPTGVPSSTDKAIIDNGGSAFINSSVNIGEIVIGGTTGGTLIISNDITTSNSALSGNIVVNSNGKIIHSSGNINIAGSLTLSPQTFTKPVSSTYEIKFNGIAQYLKANNNDIGNIRICPATSVIVSGNVIIDNLIIEATSAFRLDGSSSSVSLIINDGKTITNNGSFEIINSTNPVNIISPGKAKFVGSIFSFQNLADSVILNGLDIEPDVNLNSEKKITLSGSCTFKNLTTNAGAIFNQGTNNILTIKGNLNLASSTFIKDNGNGKILFSGRTPQTVINNDNILGNIQITGVDTNVNFQQSATINNLEVSSGAKMNLSPSINITLQGDLSLYSSSFFCDSSNKIVMNGGKKQKISPGGNYLSNILVQGANTYIEIIENLTIQDFDVVSGCIVSLLSSTITLLGNLSIAEGSFFKDPYGFSSIVCKKGNLQVFTTNGNNIGNLYIQNSGTSISLSDALIVDNLFIESGCTLIQGNKIITIKGNAEFQPNTFTANEKIIFSGGKEQSVKMYNNVFSDIEISGTNTKVTMYGTPTIKSLIIGTGANFKQTPSLTITLLGNVFISSNGFTKDSSSELIFYGLKNQTLSANDNNIGNIRISGLNTIVSFINSIYADNITVEEGAKLYLDGNSSSVNVIVSNGSKIFNSGEIRIVNTTNPVILYSSGVCTLIGNSINLNGHSITIGGIDMKTDVNLSSSEKISLIGNWYVNSLTTNSGSSVYQGSNAIYVRGNVNFFPSTFIKEGGKIIFCGGITQTLISNGNEIGNIEVSENTILKVLDSTIINNFVVSSGMFIQSSSTSLVVKGSLITLLQEGFQKENEDDYIIFDSGFPQTMMIDKIRLGNVKVKGNNTNLIISGVGSVKNLCIEENAKVTESNLCLTLSGNLYLIPNSLYKDISSQIVFNKGSEQTVTSYGNDIGNIQITNNGTKVLFIDSLTLDNVFISEGTTLQANNDTFIVNGERKINNLGTFIISNSDTIFAFKSSGSISTLSGNGIEFNGHTVYLAGLYISSSITLHAPEKLIMAGDLVISNLIANTGTYVIQGNNNILTVTGNIFLSSGTFHKDTGNGKIIFGGANSTLTSYDDLGNAEVSSNAKLVIIGSVSFNNLTVNTNSYLVQYPGANITLYGNVILSSNTFQRDITNSGKLVFNSNNAQTLYARGNNIGSVLVSGSSTTLYINDSLAISNLVIDAGNEFNATIPGIEFVVDSLGTIVVEGMFKLIGRSDSLIFLHSSIDGTRFFLHSKRSNSIWQYVKVKDCDASYKNEKIDATYGCIDAGNNVNISFDEIPPAPITDIVATTGTNEGEIIISFTAVGDDSLTGTASSYIIKISESSILNDDDFNNATEYVQSFIPLPSGNKERIVISGLIQNKMYYIAVKAKDEAGNTSPFSSSSVCYAIAQRDIIPPAQILDLVAYPGIVTGTIEISFTAPGDDGYIGTAKGYIIKISETPISNEYEFNNAKTYSQNWFPQIGGSIEHRIITGLVPNKTYYIGIVAFDDSSPTPNKSGISNIVSSIARFDDISPEEPVGVKGEFDNEGNFVLSWNPPQKNVDGTKINDLSGYKIYRANDIDGEYIFVGDTTACQWKDSTKFNNHVYYTVYAVDVNGNKSKESAIISTNEKEYITFRSDDKNVKIILSKNNSLFLYKENLKISIQKLEDNTNTRVKSLYEVNVANMNNFIFTNPAEIRFKVNYNLPIAIFWFDGVNWIKLNGKNSISNSEIIISSRRTGKFRIQESGKSSSFSIISTSPKKIFTPNGDGIYDTFQIFYSNPNDSVISLAKIYDLYGGEIADFKIGDFDNVLLWDGKDKHGNVVPSGVYIYQIEADGKVFHGTVVVAK